METHFQRICFILRQKLGLFQREQYCVLKKKCRTLPHCKVVVGEAISSGAITARCPLRWKSSDQEKQRTSIQDKVMNTSRAARQKGDGILCHSWIPRPRQQTSKKGKNIYFKSAHDEECADKYYHVFKKWEAAWPCSWWTVCQLGLYMVIQFACPLSFYWICGALVRRWSHDYKSRGKQWASKRHNKSRELLGQHYKALCDRSLM